MCLCLLLQEWNGENGHDADVMLGVEDIFRRNPTDNGSSWGIHHGRFGVQFEQWTLAGAANHPVFCKMPDLINARMEEELQSSGKGAGGGDEAENWGILHRTGPHVWTDSVLRWMTGQVRG